MKKIFLILLAFCSLSSHSQKINAIERQFALHFLQENILEMKDNLTGENCYNIENIRIDLDTLNNYNTDILFFRFKIGKNKLETNNEKWEIYFNSSSCDEYILAFNIYTNNSYRLKGFGGNDFFFLIRDINKLSDPPQKLKKLLSDLNDLNIGINFKNLHKSLLSQNFEDEFLIECLEPKKAHGKI